MTKSISPAGLSSQSKNRLGGRRDSDGALSEPNSVRDDPNYNKPDAVLARLDYSPNAELRHLQFEKEIRSLKEKKGGSRIFRR